MRIALTGGIACGKSLAASFLREMGFDTVDADDLAHELISPEERASLAKTVFRDPAARRALEARLHPLIRARLKSTFEGASTGRPLIEVIPLLFEVHWDADYDIICCVKSERDVQISRMTATRGYSREEAEARLGAQMPVAEKAARSHYVIANDGSPDDLRAAVAEFARWLAKQQGDDTCQMKS
jgi:dephospho-CoA kinase